MQVCAHRCNAHKGQERTSDSLELESQAVMSCLMWSLGPKLRFSTQKYTLLAAEPSLQLCFEILICPLGRPMFSCEPSLTDYAAWPHSMDEEVVLVLLFPPVPSGYLALNKCIVSHCHVWVTDAGTSAFTSSFMFRTYRVWHILSHHFFPNKIFTNLWRKKKQTNNQLGDLCLSQPLSTQFHWLSLSTWWWLPPPPHTHIQTLSWDSFEINNL